MRRTEPSLISSWRNSTSFLRAICSVVLFFFLWANVEPALAAAKEEVKKAAQQKDTKAAATPPVQDSHAKAEAALRTELSALAQTVKPMRDVVIKRTRKNKKGQTVTDITIIGTPEAAGVAEHRHRLQQFAEQLRVADAGAMRDFAADEEHLKAHHLSQEILNRQHQAVQRFKAQAGKVQEQIKKVKTTDTVAALYDQTQALLGTLASYRANPVPFDPNNLPVQVSKPEVRKPKLTEQELKALWSAAPKKAVRTSLLDGAPHDDSAFVADQSYKVASAGPMTSLVMAAALAPPGPEYLVATEDAQITQPIRDLATQLHNSPVEIYNWVRNNVEFIPSYGSIQGSDMTLQTKRGNAFDTASLLIALLRAAGIPARYVYGTVQIPVDHVMNWVGGVTVPEAAGNLLAQGGIPSLGLTQGGKIVACQLEHVWVEAFVDFYPSRGAKNIHPDTWVPMDASFKQYNYVASVDVQQNIPFDAQGFVQHIQQNATTNAEEGWISGIDQAYVQSQLNQYHQQVSDFIAARDQSMPVTAVIGSKVIVPLSPPGLAASLPYHRIAEGNRWASLPASLRYQFSYELQDANGDEVFSFTASTPSLAGKRLALSFRPSTSNDEDTITSYLPKRHDDGSPVRIDEFPQSLPGYLVQMSAEFTVDDQVVASGGPFQLGTELKTQKGYVVPGQGEQFRNKVLIAGEYHAVGLDLQGPSEAQMAALMNAELALKAKLQAGNIKGTTKHELVGTPLQLGVVSYFGLNDVQNQVMSNLAKVVDVRLPSFGTFQTTVDPIYSYGVPKRVTFPGVLMDIDQVLDSVQSRDANPTTRIAYARATGVRLSSFEHMVPEIIFADSQATATTHAEGVSAVKALNVAASLGQRIYKITSSNASVALPQISAAPSVIDDVSAAIQAGKEVTIHDAPIQYAGFLGTGYAVIDPETGAGAYKISSGANGAAFQIGLVGSFSAGLADGLLTVRAEQNFEYLYPVVDNFWFDFSVRFAGAAAFFLTIALIVFDPAKTPLQKVGLICSNLVFGAAGIGVSEYLAAAGIASAGIGTILLAFVAVALVLFLVQCFLESRMTAMSPRRRAGAVAWA